MDPLNTITISNDLLIEMAGNSQHVLLLFKIYLLFYYHYYLLNYIND